MKINDIIEIKIDKMANEGKGLGRYNEQVFFIPFSAPGDTLRVKVTRVTKSFCEGEIVEILKASSLRAQAPCSYYGQCGGCNFQHLIYENQLRIKTDLVKETLERFLKISDLNFKESVPSPKHFNYRNRIQLHTQENTIGFHKRKTHEILDIKECLIAEEPLNYFLSSNSDKLKSLGSSKESLFLTPDFGVDYRSETEDSESFAFFSQVNRFQNENLIKTVVNLFSVIPNDPKIRFFDLYAGSGNFSFPMLLAKNKSPVMAVELSPELVKIGNLKKKESHYKQQITFINTSVEYFLSQVSVLPKDQILLDPPRTGCHQSTIEILGAQKRDKIVYVSCNYVTLARDLALLKTTAEGWGLKLDLQSLQCFDMFPQTDHIEVVVELSIS
ncbi:MAG: class I SAM-dependent RNA methyltransferase [Bdellovibrionaceae bacterium]|nr:class I SAM-dependent RNA methyltransferase [Pseudobdellovibrionaceae bacterium]